jgi:hypothetical protein
MSHEIHYAQSIIEIRPFLIKVTQVITYIFLYIYIYIHTLLYLYMTSRHTGHVTTRYMIYHPSVCISLNSGGSNKVPDDGRLLLKHVGANM